MTNLTQVAEGGAGPPAGPVLWQRLTAGMAKAEAIAVYPELRTNPSPDELDSGARSDLILPEFVLAGDSYTVHLFFFRERLVRKRHPDPTFPRLM